MFTRAAALISRSFWELTGAACAGFDEERVKGAVNLVELRRVDASVILRCCWMMRRKADSSHLF